MTSTSDPNLLHPGRHRRRILLFGGIGVAAYLLTLLATVPARLFVPSDVPALRAVSGTIWHGEVALPGGDRLTWRFAPLRTIASLAYAADLTVTGRTTDLAGRVALGRRMVRFDSVAGRADGAFVAAVFPDLPFTCDLGLVIDIPRLAIGTEIPDAAGEIRSAPGRCTPRGGGTATAVPALLATTRVAGTATVVTITPPTQRRQILARTRIDADGRVAITIPPAGARRFPFASPPGGLSLETTM
ncbi:MAG TPA: hypothetical protein VF649_11265 [Sphingomonas sp.]|jgi:hypothetical protein|uniref:hypothetical protein n=1 Tax=Sphingomonas sp. TaxID=28214 RepID=UPI002EDB53B7